jgi:hypothetical protein
MTLRSDIEPRTRISISIGKVDENSKYVYLGYKKLELSPTTVLSDLFVLATADIALHSGPSVYDAID